MAVHAQVRTGVQGSTPEVAVAHEAGACFYAHAPFVVTILERMLQLHTIRLPITERFEEIVTFQEAIKSSLST